MILHQFPDLHWLKVQTASRFADRKGVGGIQLKNQGWPTVILNTRASNVVRDNIAGPLSIFTNLSGVSEVTVEKKRVSVSPETFFISNTGQNYTLELNEKSPTETFNIHFGEHFTQTAFQSIFTAQKDLLENYETKAGGSPEFHNRVVQAGEPFRNIINSIRNHGNDPLYLDEKLYELLNLLLQDQRTVEAMHERLPALKTSTKDEILKRLLTTTDYLYTYYAKNPGLDELATISCLSKFHFLRLFKLAYRQTPHQFITSLKINKAKDLLKKTKDDVKDIADVVGFENSSSFSRAFYKQLGFYPTHYREIVKH